MDAIPTVILSAKRSDSAADCVSYQSLRTAQVGLLDAGQGAGIEVCNSGLGVRIKIGSQKIRYPVFNKVGSKNLILSEVKR